MDRYQQLKKLFEKAIYRLKEALEKSNEFSNSELFPFFRDSAIQRFEFTFELFWKTIKFYLKNFHGIECNSPKGCIREYFARGLLTEEETVKLLEMVEYRNLTSHTYEEITADEIFERLSEFLELMQKAVARMG